MNLFIEHVDTWAATIPDQPGALASVLGALHDADANLASIIARRAPEPGKAIVFVTPLETDREIAAASQVGFNITQSLHAVRAIGRDRPGIAAELTQAVADAGINLRGFSASTIGAKFVAYFAVHSRQDADRVVETLTSFSLARAA